MQSKTSRPWLVVRERYGNTTAFINELRERLVNSGKTQSQLAERAGYSPSHVSRWINHHIPPKIETMVNLDEAMYQIETGDIGENY